MRFTHLLQCCLCSRPRCSLLPPERTRGSRGNRKGNGNDGGVLESRFGNDLLDVVDDCRDARFALRFGNEVNLVQDQDHLVGRNLADHHALRRLRLNALHAVNHNEKHVDDLGAAENRADQTGMARAVNQRVLNVLVRSVCGLPHQPTITWDRTRHIR